MGHLDLRSIVSSTIGFAIIYAFLVWFAGLGFIYGVVLPGVLVVVLLLIILRMVLDAAPIRICPNCGEETLMRRLISPFGYRYYECKQCGIRAKRKPFEDWEDASAASDDRRFRKRLKKSAAVPVDGTGTHYEGALVGTHGSLLEHKRRRQGPDDHRLISDDPAPRDP